AWLLIATLAHNLLRWVAAMGLDARQELVGSKTLRRTLLGLTGRRTPPGLLPAPPAQNLLRWVAAIGLDARQELVLPNTLRRTLLALPGRLTRSGRRLVLHLPVGWPWAAWFE